MPRGKKKELTPEEIAVLPPRVDKYKDNVYAQQMRRIRQPTLKLSLLESFGRQVRECTNSGAEEAIERGRKFAVACRLGYSGLNAYFNRLAKDAAAMKDVERMFNVQGNGQ